MNISLKASNYFKRNNIKMFIQFFKLDFIGDIIDNITIFEQ